MVEFRRFLWARMPVFLIAALALSLGVFVSVGTSRAQTPPSGIDEATGMDYTCEGTLGYMGCANLSHPQPGRPLPPPKPDVWGAIAITPTLIWGTSWNYKTKAEAQSQALKRCQTQSGTGNCKLAVTVADVCVSLAVSAAQNIYRVGGPTGAINFANDNATLECQRAGGKTCTIATSFCADGINHMLQGQTIMPNGNPIFVPQGQGLPAGRRR
jgi:hypothetical protein